MRKCIGYVNSYFYDENGKELDKVCIMLKESKYRKVVFRELINYEYELEMDSYGEEDSEVIDNMYNDLLEGSIFIVHHDCMKIEYVLVEVNI